MVDTDSSGRFVEINPLQRTLQHARFDFVDGLQSLSRGQRRYTIRTCTPLKLAVEIRAKEHDAGNAVPPWQKSGDLFTIRRIWQKHVVNPRGQSDRFPRRVVVVECQEIASVRILLKSI